MFVFSSILRRCIVQTMWNNSKSFILSIVTAELPSSTIIFFSSVHFKTLLSFTTTSRLSLLYVLLLINFIYLPPLLSFILYFCFHHSLRHYLDALIDSNLFEKKISLTKYVFFFLFLTIAFTFITLFMLSSLTQISLESAIIKYIIITLACLTLPHLLLNSIYENRYSK